jgi:hypothetical protein
LFNDDQFKLYHDDQDSSDAHAPPKHTLEELAGSDKLPQEVTREEAAELGDEWLNRIDNVLLNTDKVLTERDGQGQRGRMQKLDNWVGEVERGLLQTGKE